MGWTSGRARPVLALAALAGVTLAGAARAAHYETFAGFNDTEGFAEVVDAGLPGGRVGTLTELTCEVIPGFALDCPGDAAVAPFGDLFARAFSGGEIFFDAEFPAAVMVDARGFAQSRTGSESRTSARTETQRPAVAGMPATPARKGVYLEIAPDGGSGEQIGDYVQVLYTWRLLASASRQGQAVWTGGGIANPTLTLNELPPVQVAPDPATIVFETPGDLVMPDEGTVELTDSGAFVAQIGDVIGVFIGVEHTLDRTDQPGAGGGGATQMMGLALPEPALGVGLASAAALLAVLGRRQTATRCPE